MNIDEMDLFPHERSALYDTLCRDLRAERNEAVLHPERHDYHEYNARMCVRLLELLFREAVPKTLLSGAEGLCNAEKSDLGNKQ